MKILLLFFISLSCFGGLTPSEIAAIKEEDVKKDLTRIINPSLYCNKDVEGVDFCKIDKTVAAVPSKAEYDAALVTYKASAMSVYDRKNEIKVSGKSIMRKLREGPLTNTERDILLRMILKRLK